MTTSDIVAIISLAFAVIAFILSWEAKTKKYELLSAERTALLDWYAKTTECMMKLKMYTLSNESSALQKTELLATLSTQIEIGRFYFPNKVSDDKGSEKPAAYRGYRNIMLSFLVYIYQIYDKDDPRPYIQHANELQRLFTSQMTMIIPPSQYNKAVKKYVGIEVSADESRKDYLAANPKDIEKYFKIQ